MFDPLSLLISQGPLGLVAAVILWLFLTERKRANEMAEAHRKELQEQREHFYKSVDEVRLNQIAREQEVAQTLEEYGRSVVSAVEQTAFLAKELRGFHHERDRR